MTDFYIYFGRLHPLLVHLPIGLIIGALLLDGWRMMKPASGSDASLSVIWTAAAVSAILSALTGYVHANGDGYAQEILSFHRIGGISLAVITSIIAAIYVFRSSLLRRRVIRVPLLSFTFGMLVYTGHCGIPELFFFGRSSIGKAGQENIHRFRRIVRGSGDAHPADKMRQLS